MNLFKTIDNLNENEKKPSHDLEKKAENVKCLIIGSGPAGYTAAIYAARANLNPIMIQGLQPGGQLTTTNEVENFPGYPEGVTGPVMMEDLKKQAERFGTDIRWGIATSVDFSKKPFKVIVDEKNLYLAETVIISTGADAKYLGLESEKKFMGSGVSGCATCDGFFYKGMDIAVVGGGDTACEEAIYLAGICNKVYVIVRKEYLRASKVMQQKVFNNPKIEVLFGRNTKEVVGDKVVNGVILLKNDGTEEKINISGFFLAIGHKPNSDIFKDYLDVDDVGYIKTIPGTSKTNIQGVFACGDVQDPTYRQAVTAAGSGCQAAIDAERYLSGI
ncbi:MAG: thioredoxin-disulfide reductase [Bacteroidales bacterium]|nr:thioredoxin-disulfide reductase [Bacteroidales bacterium]